MPPVIEKVPVLTVSGFIGSLKVALTELKVGENSEVPSFGVVQVEFA